MKKRTQRVQNAVSETLPLVVSKDSKAVISDKITKAALTASDEEMFSPETRKVIAGLLSSYGVEASEACADAVFHLLKQDRNRELKLRVSA